MFEVIHDGLVRLLWVFIPIRLFSMNIKTSWCFPARLTIRFLLDSDQIFVH